MEEEGNQVIVEVGFFAGGCGFTHYTSFLGFYLKIYNLSTKKMVKIKKEISNLNPDQVVLKENKIIIKNIFNVYSFYQIDFKVNFFLFNNSSRVLK